MRSFMFLATIVAFLFTGCSKPPKPVQLDGGSAITINQELITLKTKNIPQDQFLKNNNWTYNLSFNKFRNELIPNNMVVKTFYVAHNADKIVIIGAKNVANEYKNYFLENQVKGEIKIHEVDSIADSKTSVNILFFGSKK